MRDDSKMKELILHVAAASEDDPKFGAVKLNKILFYADFLSYLSRGKSITGQEYFALGEGPAPKYLVPIREQMETEGDIVVKKVNRFGFPQHRIVPLRQPKLDHLDGEDVSIVDDVLTLLRQKNGKEVTEDSHKFSGWKAAIEQGEKTTIAYQMVCFDPNSFLEPIGLSPLEEPPLPKALIDHVYELHRESLTAA